VVPGLREVRAVVGHCECAWPCYVAAASPLWPDARGFWSQLPDKVTASWRAVNPPPLMAYASGPTAG
jgi:hypothetical protein